MNIVWAWDYVIVYTNIKKRNKHIILQEDESTAEKTDPKDVTFHIISTPDEKKYPLESKVIINLNSGAFVPFSQDQYDHVMETFVSKINPEDDTPGFLAVHTANIYALQK